ncbi:MAG: ABC transporter permease [Alphaproteobacteria bacterium]
MSTGSPILPPGAAGEPLPRTAELATLWRLLRSPVGALGLALVAFWVAVALFAPLIAPFEPNANDYLALADPTPSGVHWLGTDNLGRDIVSRLAWGARTVLVIVPIAVAAAYAIGCLMGLLAGYIGGWADTLLMRLSDVILSFPVIILYMIVLAHFGPSAINVILAVAFTAAPSVARIVRGLTLDLSNRPYVAAARLRGESPWYVMFVEILPNARGPLIVDGCLRMGYTTIAIGVLGFLGLGLPPDDPNWGGMVKDTYALMSVYPHMSLIPCGAITSLVIGFNLLADGLREVAGGE